MNFSSAFNTIVPHKLVNMLCNLGLTTTPLFMDFGLSDYHRLSGWVIVLHPLSP